MHARHYNAHSIGICYEGGLDEKGRKADTRTPAQRAALIALLRSLKVDYPDAEIMGHCELEGVHKDCPSFSCQEYRDYFESNAELDCALPRASDFACPSPQYSVLGLINSPA